MKNRIPRPNRRHKTTLFKKINTAEQGYWLGDIHADGNIQRKRNESGGWELAGVKLAHKASDILHIKKFEKFAKKHIPTCKASLHYIKPKSENDEGMCTFSINSIEVANNLVNNGVPCKKSNVDIFFPFPTEEIVSDKILPHVVRGEFDGDGCIHGKKGAYTVSFTGSNEYLEGLGRRLKKALGEEFSFGVHKIKGRAYGSTLNISGMDSVLKILEWMYKDSTEETRLNRKHELSMNAIQELKQKIEERDVYGESEIVLRNPNGEIEIVKEKQWVHFCDTRIGLIQSERQKFKAGEVKIAKGWHILNKEEVYKREIVHNYTKKEKLSVDGFEAEERKLKQTAFFLYEDELEEIRDAAIKAGVSVSFVIREWCGLSQPVGVSKCERAYHPNNGGWSRGNRKSNT